MRGTRACLVGWATVLVFVAACGDSTGGPDSVSQTDLDLSAGRFTVLSADGRTFATVSELDFSRTVLLEVGIDPPAAGIEVTGIASGLGRL